jgi:hypothetical protein
MSCSAATSGLPLPLGTCSEKFSGIMPRKLAGLSAANSANGRSRISATKVRLVAAVVSTVSYTRGGSSWKPSMPYSAAFFSMIVMARMIGT